MRNRHLPFVIALMIIFSWSSQASCLEEETHRAINEYIGENGANGFSLDNHLVNHLGFVGGVEEVLIGDGDEGTNSKKRIFEWIGYGGVQEDRPGSRSDYIFYRPTRSTNHFHNPLKSLAEAGLDDYFVVHRTGLSQIMWAQSLSQYIGGNWSWQDARRYFYIALTGKGPNGAVIAQKPEEREVYFARTFRAVGQLMHLVQDASVPEHVRNDIHILIGA